MVDTMYIYYELKSQGQYNALINKVNNYIKSKDSISAKVLHTDRNVSNSIVTHAFARTGIEEMRFKALYDRGYYTMEIKLRPRLLTHSKEYLKLLHHSQIHFVEREFNNLMHKELVLEVPGFYDWKVRRIDYAVDVNIPQNLIGVYISLLKKSNIPERILERETTQRWQCEDNNLYLDSKNYRINIYDRYTTLRRKQEEGNKKIKNIEENIMRFEIQVTVNTNKLKEKKLITQNSVSQLMTNKMFLYFFENHLFPIIGKGDYYNLKTAKKKCKRERLGKLLDTIRERGSVYRSKELYSRSRDKYKKFSSLINDLYRAGVNPVTLEEGEEPLPGLYDMIENALESEKRILIARRMCHEQER